MPDINYTNSFLKVANTYPDFKEALDFIKANSEGRVWLIGGFVCRSIVKDLYNIPMSKDADFDFIVEKPKEIKLPKGWSLRKNSYNNPKIITPDFEIDYIPLDSVHSIIRRGLKPSIENFLSGTPLNIQSIAYDVINNEVIGEVGKKSIKNKVIAVNNLEQAKHRAEKKGVLVSDLVRDIAGQFNFKAETV